MTRPRKLVYGVGINDMPIGFRKSKIYILWRDMLKRCYSSVYQRKRPTYIGVTVCKEWHILSNFVVWVESQDREGKEIDKDILCPGNKIYSPETCVFVSRQLNSLLLGSNATRGKCPKGVDWDKDNRKYRASMMKFGKIKCFIGRFDCVKEAHRAYCEAKSVHIREVAENLTDADTSDIERTRAGLLEHADIEERRWEEAQEAQGESVPTLGGEKSPGCG